MKPEEMALSTLVEATVDYCLDFKERVEFLQHLIELIQQRLEDERKGGTGGSLA